MRWRQTGRRRRRELALLGVALVVVGTLLGACRKEVGTFTEDPSTAALTVYLQTPRQDEDVTITWTGTWHDWGEYEPLLEWPDGTEVIIIDHLDTAFSVSMTVPTDAPRQVISFPADDEPDAAEPGEVDPDNLLFGLWDFRISIEPSSFGHAITCNVEIRPPKRDGGGHLELFAVEHSARCGGPDGVLNPAFVHDLAVTGIFVEPDPPIPGSPTTLSVVVTNQGEATEEFSISLLDAPDPDKVTVPDPVAGAATATVEGLELGPGRSNDPDAAVFGWDTTGLALGPQTVAFVVNAVPGETETDDNDRSATFVFEPDQDGDVVVDDADNCLVHVNPSQTDVDGDGFGNRCDPDFDQDGVVALSDFSFLGAARTNYDPLADLNSDGVVDVQDQNILNTFSGQGPGPSGLCPGVPPNTPACP